jgi:hypothetical protein
LPERAEMSREKDDKIRRQLHMVHLFMAVVKISKQQKKINYPFNRRFLRDAHRKKKNVGVTVSCVTQNVFFHIFSDKISKPKVEG